MPDPDRLEKQTNVMVVFPFDMSVRTFKESVVYGLLEDGNAVNLTVISRNREDFSSDVSRFGLDRLMWQQILRPFHKEKYHRLFWFNFIRFLCADLRSTFGYYFFMMMVHRFNVLCDFKGFKTRLRQSADVRKKAIREGLPHSHWFGFPFPQSRPLFQLLRWLYFKGWQRHPYVAKQFANSKPDILVLTHLQTAFATPYVLEASRRNIPVIGLVGSWDQPTTKGPLMPHLTMILAQNRQVAQDLVRYHHYPEEKIQIIGWTAFDRYAKKENLCSRSDFLSQLGLAEQTRYILLGAYSERLGDHEPDLCRHLIAAIKASDFGPNVTLIIRTHPLDTKWRSRFGDLHCHPDVIVENGELSDHQHLTNLLYHAQIVLSSAGTISLDALALDTPSAALVLEDETSPYYDRSARHFDMEHIANTVDGEGILKLSSLEAVISACQASFQDRDFNKAKRLTLRKHVLSPFDGQSKNRIVQWILDHVNIVHISRHERHRDELPGAPSHTSGNQL